MKLFFVATKLISLGKYILLYFKVIINLYLFVFGSWSSSLKLALSISKELM